GRVLLVRHSYGPPVWALPGAGIDRGGEPAGGAVREFGEEPACPRSDVRELTRDVEPGSGSTAPLHASVARLSGTPRADRREIVAAEFFEPGALPSPADRRARRWVSEAAARLEQR